MSANPHIGPSFEDFLIEEGIYEEVNEVAVKRVLAWQIEQSMKEQGLSKTAMAERMHTSRAAIDRLLDPKNEAITLHTLLRAAHCVGKRLKLELVEPARERSESSKD
jgi:predicted XRE-type DNA-binding protein